MDSDIKQRLVGIAVIFALAIIFLPMILDGSGVDKKILKVDIPRQPVLAASSGFETKIIELQAKVDKLPKLEARFTDEKSSKADKPVQRKPEKKQAVNRTKPKTEKQIIAKLETTTKPESSSKPDPKPKLKQKPKSSSKVVPKKPVGGDAYVLQVGSYRDRSKAIAQRDQMRKSRIAAVFIERFDNNNDASYRVRLGPFLNRDQSKIAQNKIKAKYNVDGLIMKYER